MRKGKSKSRFVMPNGIRVRKVNKYNFYAFMLLCGTSASATAYNAPYQLESKEAKQLAKELNHNFNDKAKEI